MEQYLHLALIFVPLLSFYVGFMFGQNSVKIVGTRSELLKQSNNLTVQRNIVDEPEDPYVTTPGRVMPLKGTMVAPPQYQHLVEEWRREQEGS